MYLLLFWTVRLKNPCKTEKIVRHIIHLTPVSLPLFHFKEITRRSLRGPMEALWWVSGLFYILTRWTLPNSARAWCRFFWHQRSVPENHINSGEWPPLHGNSQRKLHPGGTSALPSGPSHPDRGGGAAGLAYGVPRNPSDRPRQNAGGKTDQQNIADLSQMSTSGG